jgi:hypothetical protein
LCIGEFEVLTAVTMKTAVFWELLAAHLVHSLTLKMERIRSFETSLNIGNHTEGESCTHTFKIPTGI